MYPLLKIRYKRNFDRRKTSLIMIVKKSIIFNVFDLYVLPDLVPFVQFKKREKHPWKSVTKGNTPSWLFFTFLNCTNSTKSRNASHMIPSKRLFIKNCKFYIILAFNT